MSRRHTRAQYPKLARSLRHRHLSVLATGLRDTGACGLYGIGGWQPAWLPLLRRASRVYVALDRDATDRAIALARTFGTRGRVLIPPEDLWPKGDLNDWLRMGAKGDPTAFQSMLERALATSPTPWALQIQRLPPDLAPWDLEDHAGARDLLYELGHQGALSRDAHLRLWRNGVAWRSLPCRRRPANSLRARTRSCRYDSGSRSTLVADMLSCRGCTARRSRGTSTACARCLPVQASSDELLRRATGLAISRRQQRPPQPNNTR